MKGRKTAVNKDNVAVLVAEYNTGQYSIAMLSVAHRISVGAIYNALLGAGCNFTKKRRKPISEEERRNRSNGSKGKVISAEQRKAISEKNSCNYNGLNGWGHCKTLPNGYVVAYAPKHPNAHNDGYVLLHRLIAEYQLGRYLREDEVVHHMNHIRNDNRIENLIVMGKKEHTSMHMKERHKARGTK